MNIKNVKNTSNDYKVGDILFAMKKGYVPWPAKLIEKRTDVAVVKFMLTNDTHHIRYSKIWPYTEEYKKQFVTRNALDFEDFVQAIFMTDQLLGIHRAAIINDLLNPVDSVSAWLNDGQRQLQLMHRLRGQHAKTDPLEPNLVASVNMLRGNLTTHNQNYVEAYAAFEQLLQMPLTQLLIVRNLPAVDSIRQLTRFCSYCVYTPRVKQEVMQVRQYALDLMERFRSLLSPLLDTSHFWSQYCKLVKVYMNYTKPLEEA